MAKLLTFVLLLKLLSQAFCLQCNTCHGEYNCVGENITCEDPSASCTTSVRKAYVSFLEFQSVRKGCARQLYPFESISLTSHLLSLSYQASYCAEDGCNNETYFVSLQAPANHMRCHTCTSQGAWCPEASRTQISCIGHQDQCVDLDITGKLGQYSNLKLKGCTNLPGCEDTLSFNSGSHTIHASCCNTPLCNTFSPDLHLHNQAANGLECYSCVDEDSSGSGCANESISKVQCTGVHTNCLEGIGKSRKAGQDVGFVAFKGCASPAMCQSSLLALVQELDNAEVICCQGNLCNDRIVNGVITQPRIPADTLNTTVAEECALPSPTSSGSAPSPDCINSDEVEDDSMVEVPSPAGVIPSLGNHTNEKMSGAADENLVDEENVRPPSHPTYTDDENLLGNSSESNVASPSSISHVEHGSSGGSSVMNLDTSNSSASTNSSNSHGNVAVLIPFIIPKKDATTTTPTIPSATNEVLVARSNSDESESEECEAEEEGISTGQRILSDSENNNDGSPSTHPTTSSHESRTPENTPTHAGDHSSDGVFVRGGSDEESAFYSSPTESTHNVLNAGRHGTTQSPATDTTGSTNVENFIHGGRPESYTPRPGHSVTSNHGLRGGEDFVVESSTPLLGRNGTWSDEITNHVFPIPSIISKDNSSFDTAGEKAAGTSATANAGTAGAAIDPTGSGTSRPKNKVPCRRPGSKTWPGANLVSSTGTGTPAAEKNVTRSSSTSLYSDTKSPEHNTAGKVNLDNGALGVTFHLRFFVFTLALAALLH